LCAREIEQEREHVWFVPVWQHTYPKVYPRLAKKTAGAMRSSIMVDAAGTQGAVAGGQNVTVKTRMEIVNNVFCLLVWRTDAFCVRDRKV